jgi:hypothetical protein
MLRNTIVASIFGVASALAISASAQAMTFADYSATSSNPNISWTQSTSLTSGVLSTTGVGASANTNFSFLTPALSALADLPALFTLSASATANDPAQTGLGQIAEQNLSGSFSFIYTGATPLVVGTHTYATGADLLTGTFTGAELIGPNFGSTGSVQDAIFSGGTVSFTSDIVKFSTVGDKALSVELTSVLPFLTAANPSNALSTFTAVSTGSFASELAAGGGGGVPEPVTWASMLLGFGGIGLAARRARRKSAVAFT